MNFFFQVLFYVLKFLLGVLFVFYLFMVFLIFFTTLHISNQMILTKFAKQHIACRIEVVQKLLFGGK